MGPTWKDPDEKSFFPGPVDNWSIQMPEYHNVLDVRRITSSHVVNYIWGNLHPASTTTPNVPTSWSILVDHKIGTLPYSHQSQVWHPSELAWLLDRLYTCLDDENLLVTDQVVNMMGLNFVTIQRAVGWVRGDLLIPLVPSPTGAPGEPHKD